MKIFGVVGVVLVLVLSIIRTAAHATAGRSKVTLILDFGCDMDPFEPLLKKALRVKNGPLIQRLVIMKTKGIEVNVALDTQDLKRNRRALQTALAREFVSLNSTPPGIGPYYEVLDNPSWTSFNSTVIIIIPRDPVFLQEHDAKLLKIAQERKLQIIVVQLSPGVYYDTYGLFLATPGDLLKIDNFNTKAPVTLWSLIVAHLGRRKE